MKPGKVVCAGIPRSGSTMLYRALMKMPPGSTTPTPQTGPVLKTHTYKPKDLLGVRAAVFIFGDPIASIISTRMRRWEKGHFENCGAGNLEPEFADIFRSDILNYEKMYDSWMCRQPFDTICVRYERLNENIDVVSEFLEIRLELPNWKERTDYSSSISMKDIEAAQLTYKNLSNKIANAPDLSIWRRQEI